MYFQLCCLTDSLNLTDSWATTDTLTPHGETGKYSSFFLFGAPKTHLFRERSRCIAASHYAGQRLGGAKQPERHDSGEFSLIFARLLPNDRIGTAAPHLSRWHNFGREYCWSETGSLKTPPRTPCLVLEFVRIGYIGWINVWKLYYYYAVRDCEIELSEHR